jgi:hypothetical protein
VALVLQLDTAALVSRLSSDAALRKFLVDIAQKQAAAGPPAVEKNAPSADANGHKSAPPNGQSNATPDTTAAPSAASAVIQLTDIEKQNLKDLVVNNVAGIPQSLSDWTRRWNPDNFVMKSCILLSVLLLGLGAPFWYGALQNLLRLRSLLANKDDQQRQHWQAPNPVTPQPGA